MQSWTSSLPSCLCANSRTDFTWLQVSTVYAGWTSDQYAPAWFTCYTQLHTDNVLLWWSRGGETPCLILLTVVSRLVMNLFPQLWAQPCLAGESCTYLASSPMVSEVWFFIFFFLILYCFRGCKLWAADRKWICLQHGTLWRWMEREDSFVASLLVSCPVPSPLWSGAKLNR